MWDPAPYTKGLRASLATGALGNSRQTLLPAMEPAETERVLILLGPSPGAPADCHLQTRQESLCESSDF